MICAVIAANPQNLVIFPEKQKKLDASTHEIMAMICRDHAVDFQGGRRIAAQLLNIRHKPPICISLSNCDIFFPTRGHLHPKCHWLNYNYIARFQKITGNQCLIIFTNGYKMRVDTDVRTIRMQMKRCEALIKRRATI